MSKFKITKIEIENFRSIQSKVILNIKPGLFSIVGVNNDEKASTNGCGKSTIVSALYWCLTGNTLTNEVLADEVINNKTGKNCKVTLFIDSDQGEICITRCRKDDQLGNNLLLQINGEDLSCHKIADTQDRLNKLIKIPFDLLHSTIMMTCDIKSAFSQLTPQQRIQTLESIRDYSVWDKIRDEANKDIKDYNSQIQENKLNLSNLTGSMNTYKELREKTYIELKNLQENYSEDELNSKINELNTKKENIEKSINTVTEKIKELENKTFQDTSSLKEELNNIVDEANNFKLQQQNLESSNKITQKDIDLIDKWFINDKCPTCGRLLERTEEDIKQKQTDKNNLLNYINENNKEIEKLAALITNKRKEWSDKNTILQQLDKDRLENTNLIKNLSKESSDYTINLNIFIQELNKLILVKENHTNNLNKVTVSLNEYENKINILKKDIEVIKDNIEKLEKKRQLSDYYYKLLSSKGELRPYLLNKDIMYLNKCMQKYISRFFNNTTVELKLNGASIDINIDSNGIKKLVSSLSGGEKKRLDLSIQLGLYDLVQSTSQIGFNTIWLDEIEQCLDDLGVEQLIEVIEDKSQDVESVYWISNNSAVKQEIPNKIVCTKSLGKTQISEI